MKILGFYFSTQPKLPYDAIQMQIVDDCVEDIPAPIA